MRLSVLPRYFSLLALSSALVLSGTMLAQRDALATGRQLTEMFYAGRQGEVWQKTTEKARRELPSVAALVEFRKKVEDLVGREIAILDERVIQGEGTEVYERAVRFEKLPDTFVVRWGIDAQGRIDDFSIRPAGPASEVSYQTKTPLQLPFHGTWVVGAGGRTPEQNHHNADYSNRFALDLNPAEDAGATIERPRSRNEDYACFGQPVLAAAEGRVAAVKSDVADNPPGHVNERESMGNYVVVDHGKGEFSVLGHLKKGSPRVQPGQAVRAGEAVAECGNSGNSNGPHLHYNLQTTSQPNAGTSLPAQFLSYVADGKAVEKGEPIRGQLIRHGKE